MKKKHKPKTNRYNSSVAQFILDNGITPEAVVDLYLRGLATETVKTNTYSKRDRGSHSGFMTVSKTEYKATWGVNVRMTLMDDRNATTIIMKSDSFEMKINLTYVGGYSYSTSQYHNALAGNKEYFPSSKTRAFVVNSGMCYIEDWDIRVTGRFSNLEDELMMIRLCAC